ncbi:MAG: hypothetical protein A2521_05285 [Deltaproteobacteria bacterium RIFOXYD12_FULL_57_12]|nr:MAG: hypothetical protein A2521_05285 [Deltaproteobacteria bacterium RIFOXYD12_FULL_57_12]
MAYRRANSYLPIPARIIEVIVENSQIRTFVLAFVDEEYNRNFTHSPGQFMMVSVPHRGEAPISISSTPSRPGVIHLSVRRAGWLTTAMYELAAGAVIGLRGPFGTSFPLEQLQGRDLLFVAGGIGLAPLRSVINFRLDQPDASGKVTVLYGSRTPADIAFRTDLDAWQNHPAVTCLLTVDESQPGWTGPVGVVTTLLDQIELDIPRTVALLCGPPLMIRFVLAKLSRAGFDSRDIITTLERHMKCGLGVCGHCHMDDKLICVDGPVFSHAQLLEMEVAELQIDRL